MSVFSDTLVRLRKQAGLSQQELADKLNVSRSRIGMYETAKREPDFEILTKIANIFNTTSGVLLGEASFAELVAATEGNKILMDYFEWERSKKPNDTYFTFPEDERRLLDLYRDLNTEGQEKLVGYADDLVTSGKYKQYEK